MNTEQHLDSDMPHLYFSRRASSDEEKDTLLSTAETLALALELENGVDLLFNGYQGARVPKSQLTKENHACLVFAVLRCCDETLAEELKAFINDLVDAQDSAALVKQQALELYDRFVAPCNWFI